MNGTDTDGPNAVHRKQPFRAGVGFEGKVNVKPDSEEKKKRNPFNILVFRSS